MRSKRVPARAQPTRYKAHYAHEAKGLCFHGITLKGLADYFGVSVKTIQNWQKRHEAFAEAMKAKDHADDEVERALFKRAVGHEVVEVHREARVVGVDEDGRIVDVDGGNAVELRTEMLVRKEVVKENPPEVAAARLWLMNRRPEKWRDRHEVEVADGATMVAQLNGARDRMAAYMKAREAREERAA